MNNSTDLCDVARSIVSTTELFVIHVLEVIVGLIAVVPNALTLFLFWNIKVFHLNLRIMLANLGFDLFLYSLTLAEKSFRRLLTPVCDLPIKLRSCLVQEWANSIPLHHALLSLVILCLDRLHASIRYRTYDSNAPPYFSLFLLVCSWSYTLYVQISAYVLASDSDQIPVCDAVLFLSEDSTVPVLVTFITLEVIALSISTFAYVYNRFILKRMAMNRAKFSLSARFQIDQNVKLNAAIFPSDLLHVCCYLPSYIFLLVTLFNVSLSMATRMWFLHMTNLYRITYALVHPILLITRNPTLRQGVEKSFVGRMLAPICRRCRGQEYERRVADIALVSSNETLAHFNHLEKTWSIECKKFMRS